MYLFIFEDGSIWKNANCSIDDLEACDNGVLQIIDITDNKTPTEYCDGQWQLIN